MVARCYLCRADSQADATVCRVCGFWLGGVVCFWCSSVNPPGHRDCGYCGQVLPTADQAREARKGAQAVAVSPLAVVGLGSTLAVASAAYPWYLLDSLAALPGVSIAQQLAFGWSWFPGLPLVIVIASAMLATFLSLLAYHGRSYPVPCILASLLGLGSALWLWEGLVGGVVWGGEGEMAPMLATVGTILALVGAFLVARPGQQGVAETPRRGAF